MQNDDIEVHHLLLPSNRYTSCGVAGDHSLGGSGVLAVQLKQVGGVSGQAGRQRGVCERDVYDLTHAHHFSQCHQGL
jgi:hypothetical protein